MVSNNKRKQKLLEREGVSLSKGVSNSEETASTSRRERKYLGGGNSTEGGTKPKTDVEAGMRFAPGTASKLPFDTKTAIKHLSGVDKKMGKLIDNVGAFRLELDEMLTPFEALAESIVYQQLTGKAAATIFARVKALYGDKRLPKPEKIIATPDELLRSAGLSQAKMLALKDLATKQRDGEIPTLKQLETMDDDEIVEALTAVRGVGRWTVEMLLIFRLGRPDVLPINDYGVRKGFARTYKRGADLPTPRELGDYGERWRPFRSVASWYLWRALDL